MRPSPGRGEGQRVELLPSEFTTRSAWRDEHPDTLALAAPAGPSGFDLAKFVIVVDFSEEASAYPVPARPRVGVVNDTVAGVDIAVVGDPTEPDRWAVFSRRLDEVTVELELGGEVLRDRRTGTTFDPARGFALDGELEGQILDLLPGLTAFASDDRTFSGRPVSARSRRWRSPISSGCTSSPATCSATSSICSEGTAGAPLPARD